MKRKIKLGNATVDFAALLTFFALCQTHEPPTK